MPTAGFRSLLAPWLGGVGAYVAVVTAPPEVWTFVAPLRPPVLVAPARRATVRARVRPPVVALSDPHGRRQ